MSPRPCTIGVYGPFARQAPSCACPCLGSFALRLRPVAGLRRPSCSGRAFRFILMSVCMCWCLVSGRRHTLWFLSCGPTRASLGQSLGLLYCGLQAGEQLTKWSGVLARLCGGCPPLPRLACEHPSSHDLSIALDVRLPPGFCLRLAPPWGVEPLLPPPQLPMLLPWRGQVVCGSGHVGPHWRWGRSLCYTTCCLCLAAAGIIPARPEVGQAGLHTFSAVYCAYQGGALCNLHAV